MGVVENAEIQVVTHAAAIVLAAIFTFALAMLAPIESPAYGVLIGCSVMTCAMLLGLLAGTVAR
jgi:hypothetical protein